MRLKPPEPDISGDDPYSEDLFERKPFGDSLTLLFSKMDESIVLSIESCWGDGKTTFAKMWIADLEKQGKTCIYYDAYRDIARSCG